MFVFWTVRSPLIHTSNYFACNILVLRFLSCLNKFYGYNLWYCCWKHDLTNWSIVKNKQNSASTDGYSNISLYNSYRVRYSFQTKAFETDWCKKFSKCFDADLHLRAFLEFPFVRFFCQHLLVDLFPISSNWLVQLVVTAVSDPPICDHDGSHWQQSQIFYFAFDFMRTNWYNLRRSRLDILACWLFKQSFANLLLHLFHLTSCFLLPLLAAKCWLYYTNIHLLHTNINRRPELQTILQRK